MNTLSLAVASILLLGAGPSPAPEAETLTAVPGIPDVFAVRVGRAETIAQGTLEHAVILVEGGKITIVGEDLPIERGIPVIDAPDWVVTPGLVNCYSRFGMDSQAGRLSEPQSMASGELWPGYEFYDDLLEAGVTTLGLYPAGSGIPGQAVAIKPLGDTREEMILSDGVYLKILVQGDPRSKAELKKGFEKVDEYDEKVQKAREKWEKAVEKAKKKKKSKKDDDEDKDEKKDEDPGPFVAPEPDAKVKPFIDLRAKELTALMRIRKAGDYLHLIDALGEEDIDWMLRVPLRNDIDLYEVADKIGERELRVIVNPVLTLRPNTRRLRNIPAELDRAGAKLVLVPRSDRLSGHEDWVKNVGELVAEGLDRQAALAAMTLEAAHALGLGERLGSLEAGKDANMVFWNGDPFEPGTEIQAVLLEGELVHGEMAQ